MAHSLTFSLAANRDAFVTNNKLERIETMAALLEDCLKGSLLEGIVDRERIALGIMRYSLRISFILHPTP